CLWFNDNAEEAVKFYTSIFRYSKIKTVTRYGEAGAKASGQPKGTVMTITFQLDGQEFLALNGGPHFAFSPAISLVAKCKTQKEIKGRAGEKAGGGGKGGGGGVAKEKIGGVGEDLPRRYRKDDARRRR